MENFQNEIDEFKVELDEYLSSPQRRRMMNTVSEFHYNSHKTPVDAQKMAQNGENSRNLYESSVSTVKKEHSKNSINLEKSINRGKKPPTSIKKRPRSSHKGKENNLPNLGKLMKTSENAISNALKTLFKSYKKQDINTKVRF